jgi:hypothetical protein
MGANRTVLNRHKRGPQPWRCRHGGGALVEANRRGGCLGHGGSVCGARAQMDETNSAWGRKRSAGGRWLLLRGGGGHQRGGVRQQRCHIAWGRRGAWVRPMGGVPTAARPRRARSARLCFDSGVPTWLTHGPRLSVGEGVRSERHGHVWASAENAEWAEPRMNNNI